MKTNQDIVRDFYTAFSQKDYKTMGELYHSEAYFKDEAFELNGKEPAAMWHMLCLRGKDLEIEFSDVTEESEDIVTAHWEAKYTFSATKRKVHNKIDARFKFKDGKIVEHIDTFNFWKWSGQALGLPGILLGWTPIIKNKVREQAANSLNAFISSHPEYQ